MFLSQISRYLYLRILIWSSNPSSVTILLGGSGCGKSSVLKAAAGLIPITGGTVKYGENSIYGLNQKEYARMQQHTGFMFQDGALWANKSIQDNLSLPLEIADPKAKPEAVQRKIEEALDIFSMCGSLNSRPSGLSSGERKIVSFLRAIITEPDILFPGRTDHLYRSCECPETDKKPVPVQRGG